MYKKKGHRAPGFGSISQNASGTWRAQILVPSSEGGKPIRKTQSFPSKGKAEEWLLRMRGEIEVGLSVENINYRVGEYFSRWLDLKRDSIVATTFDDYSRNGRLYILPYLGNRFLRKIKVGDINSLFITLTNQGVGGRTKEYVYTTLRMMFSDAIREGAVSINPCVVAKRPSAQNHRKANILSPTELATFLEIAKDTPYYVLYLVAVTTGLRLGELLGLRLRNVDLGNQVILVSEQIRSRHIKGKPREFVATKTFAGNRILPIGKKLTEELKQHFDNQQRLIALMGASWKDWGLVFPSRVGTPLQPGYLQKGAKHIFGAIGLGNEFTFHTLRHTAASFLIHHGMSLIEVSRYLGHSSTTITMEYYGHLVAGGLERARAIQDFKMIDPKEIVDDAEADIFSLQKI